ncbi:MAG TPA: cytochrome c family protein [Pararhizobium sp.]|nr:cytochrome c family protein [Pararhizobium sp.]
MNSSILNMTAGAFLGTCFVVMTLSIVSGAIYYSPTPEKEGFVIKAETPQASGAAQPAKPEVPPIAPLLAKADVKKGAQIFKKCEACHDATKGGPNKIGPNLWGVVDRPIASHPGFSYSSSLKDFSDGSKKHWTYKLLNHWIHDPRELASGTSMTFPGVKKDQDRADVIAYLHTLSDNPVPFPKPEEKSSEAKPAADSGKAAAKPAEDSAAAAPAKDAASGDQSSKPEAAPAAKAPAGNEANSGSKSSTQQATEQKAPAAAQ